MSLNQIFKGAPDPIEGEFKNLDVNDTLTVNEVEVGYLGVAGNSIINGNLEVDGILTVPTYSVNITPVWTYSDATNNNDVTQSSVNNITGLRINDTYTLHTSMDFQTSVWSGTEFKTTTPFVIGDTIDTITVIGTSLRTGVIDTRGQGYMSGGDLVIQWFAEAAIPTPAVDEDIRLSVQIMITVL
jgi:hypothetical protein